MALPIPIKSATDIRTDILRSIKNGLIQRGVTAPNVGPLSDYYGTADGLGSECATAQANAAGVVNTVMPDTVVGADLDAWLILLGIPRRTATGSAGQGTYSGTVRTYVAAGSQLIDTLSGTRVQVASSAGGFYSNSNWIALTSVDTGATTNLPVGTVLTWLNPPVGAAQTMVLGQAMVGGADAESDDAARSRLIAYLQNPPAAGNWTWLTAAIESANPSVEKAFVYPLVGGPGSYGYAATSQAILSPTRLRNSAVVTPPAMPEYACSYWLSINNVAADVAFYVVDQGDQSIVPYAAPYYCACTAVTSTVDITVGNLTFAPVVGGTIEYVDPTTFTRYQATITAIVSVTGSSAPYTVRMQLSNPFPNIGIGSWISQASDHSPTYISTILDTYAAMGPGQCIPALMAGNPSARLPKTFSTPLDAVFIDPWPASIGNNFIRALNAAGASASWAYQNNGTTDPPLPGSFNTGPSIFVPRNIAVYTSL